MVGAGSRLQPFLQSEQCQVQQRHRGTAPRITTDGRTDTLLTQCWGRLSEDLGGRGTDMAELSEFRTGRQPQSEADSAPPPQQDGDGDGGSWFTHPPHTEG